MSRPRIHAQLAVTITQGVPKRVAKKLDRDPDVAEGWTWEADGDTWTVTTPKETVTLRATDGLLAETEALHCTCLLAPRCLHLLAVVSRLELAVDDAGVEEAEEVEEVPEQSWLSANQRAAAQALRAAAADVLERGARTCGAVAQAQLLRATHACRLEGLHRLAQSGLRLVQRIRDVRDDTEAPLSLLSDDALELLGTAHALSTQQSVPPHVVGTARRAYAPVGALTIHGVLTERIASAEGYAGVVTHFVDAEGKGYSVADVRGGSSSRGLGAYDGAIGLGSTITHRAGCRSRVLVQGATASSDGRLGSGAKVRAVEGGASRWDDAVVGAMFDRPLDQQLASTWDQPDTADPGLLFTTGTILGADDDALWMELTAGKVSAIARASLAGDNLRVLAQAPGLRARVVGRVDRLRPRTLQLLAISPSPQDPDALELPEDWAGVCNLGLDTLPRSSIRDLHDRVPRFEVEPEPDPFLALRRRLGAVLIGGRGTVSPALSRQIEREANQLRARLCPTGADALQHLAKQALDSGRALDGRRIEANADALAQAWLAAAMWQRHAHHALVRASWER